MAIGGGEVPATKDASDNDGAWGGQRPQLVQWLPSQGTTLALL